MNRYELTALTVVAFVMSAGATNLLRRFLESRKILDQPSSRSSHLVATPRGGGLAMYAVITLSWGLIAAVTPSAPQELRWILLCSLALAIPSLVDDLVGLSMLPRLLCQIVIASIGAYLLSGPLPVFQGILPTWANSLATVFIWVGFINLFNFTDGIDGNAGTKATVLGFGLFVLSLIGAVQPAFGQMGIATAAAALGFLIWNWHPARVFMGDVGSIPIGFLLAWLLLRTASEGQWAPALILPLVYLTDTGLTYVAKIARRERFWHPHRDHFYQRAARRPGTTHAQVVKVVLLGDVVLVGMAILATRGLIWPALVGATLTAIAVIERLRRGPPGRTLS
jgi:UDP-N-acetylmuramyl pentapeptide phosphotransferase/UDP-N-acetylglucosamine-1-phosphate transferase